MQPPIDLDALSRRLTDDFSRSLLQGAIRVAADDENPIRGNLFAAAIRELITHTLHVLAPDDQVKACSWFKVATATGAPSRAQRQLFMIQGGLSEMYVRQELKVDVRPLMTQLTSAFAELNKATHLRPATVVSSSHDVSALMNDTFIALISTFDLVDTCRQKMMSAVTDEVIEEANQEVISSTIQTIDEKATHHSIDEVHVDEVHATKIDAHYVWYRATGTITAELQWGSSSDFRRGDGIAIDHSFPFVCDIPAPVSDPKTFETSMIELKVGDGGWWDDHADEVP